MSLPSRKPAFMLLVAGLAALALAACAHPKTPTATPAADTNAATTPRPADPLVPSPRLIVGRILDIDLTQGLAFVDLAADAPSAALVEGAELVARTLDFRETARLRVSRYVRGRTLGTKLLSGQPAPEDEVVWQAP